MFRLPATRREFWEDKITANKDRDQRNIAALREMGWRVLEVWECAFKGPGRLNQESMSDLVAEWILNGTDVGQIEGHSFTTPA